MCRKVRGLMKISLLSRHPAMIQWSECFIRLFIVLHISLFSMPSSDYQVFRMFHYLFIVLIISLFSRHPIHDAVIRMFHCLFTVLTITVLTPSSHDPVIRMFHNCHFIVLTITVLHAIQLWSSDQNVPLSFHSFKYLTILQRHPAMIMWSKCFIVLSLFWRSHCFLCHSFVE